MKPIEIKKIERSHKEAFLEATNESVDFHKPWIQAPLTESKFDFFLIDPPKKTIEPILSFAKVKLLDL